MINIDKLSKLSTPYPAEEGILITYWFDLSNEVKIEKRIVNSIPSVLGSIFGLKDLISIFIAFLIGRLQAKAFIFDIIANIFRVNLNAHESVQNHDTTKMNVLKLRMSY